VNLFLPAQDLELVPWEGQVCLHGHTMFWWYINGEVGLFQNFLPLSLWQTTNLFLHLAAGISPTDGVSSWWRAWFLRATVFPLALEVGTVALGTLIRVNGCEWITIPWNQASLLSRGIPQVTLPPVGTVSVLSGLLCSNRVTILPAICCSVSSTGVLGGCDSMSWIVMGGT